MNREDVKFRDVSSLVLPCEPWSEENVSIESREWGRYAETKVSRERGIEGERGKEGGVLDISFLFILDAYGKNKPHQLD